MRAPISLATILSLLLLAGAMPARAQDQGGPIVSPTGGAPTGAPAIAAPGGQPDGQPAGQPAGQPDETPAGEANPDANPPAKAPTAAERQAQARSQYEMRLRAMMTDFGIEEAASQDAVIAYLAEDEAGRRTVRGAARRMMIAVRSGAAPDKMREAIAIYKAALDADQERRRAAQSALDAKIGFSLSPRLEATLWILGVLGEGQSGVPLAILTPRSAKNGPGDGAHDGAHGGNRDGKHDDKHDDKRDDKRDGGQRDGGQRDGGQRDGGQRDGGQRDGGQRDGVRRGGTIRGVVTGKAQGWLEVRADGGATDRYLPFWAGGEPPIGPTPGQPLSKDEWARLNGLTLETLARVKIGDRVSLDWVWSERKRVLRLEILPPLTAAPEPDPNAPAAPNPPQPAPQTAPQPGDAAPTHPAPAKPGAQQQAPCLNPDFLP